MKCRKCKSKLDGPEDNIKIDVGEIDYGCKDWIYLAHDRDWWRLLVNVVINFRAL
jgi:hypothetical protein